MKKETSVKTLFLGGLRWNIIGSVIYEFTRFSHQIALLSLIGIHSYGIIGTFFSCVYITIHCADFESAQSLLPFLSLLQESRMNYRVFLATYLLINTFLLCACAFFFVCIYATYSPSLMVHEHSFLFMTLVVSEGVRSFLRYVLQIHFQAKPVVMIDLTLTAIYYFTVWIPVIAFSKPLSFYLIFIPYALCSLIAACSFMMLAWIYSTTLPYNITRPQIFHRSFFTQLAKTRILTYLLHVSNYFFTGNMLAPLFALKFGLEYGGVIKFASYLADGIKSIIKASLGFSGGALLSAIRKKSFTIKKKAFQILWHIFTSITYPLIIFILINFKKLYILFSHIRGIPHASTYTQNYVVPHHILVLASVLLLVSFIETLFVAYEEFYIIEGRVDLLCLFKLFEFFLFYILIISQEYHSALITLIGALTTRILSFSLLTFHASRAWGIKPRFALKRPSILAITTILSVIVYFL